MPTTKPHLTDSVGIYTVARGANQGQRGVRQRVVAGDRDDVLAFRFAGYGVDEVVVYERRLADGNHDHLYSALMDENRLVDRLRRVDVGHAVGDHDADAFGREAGAVRRVVHRLAEQTERRRYVRLLRNERNVPNRLHHVLR